MFGIIYKWRLLKDFKILPCLSYYWNASFLNTFRNHRDKIKNTFKLQFDMVPNVVSALNTWLNWKHVVMSKIFALHSRGHHPPSSNLENNFEKFYFCLPHGRPRCTSFPSPSPSWDFLLLGVGNLLACIHGIFLIFQHLIVFQNQDFSRKIRHAKNTHFQKIKLWKNS